MSKYSGIDLMFANVNGEDITIGQDMDFGSCEEVILKRIAEIDSLDEAAMEMDFPSGKELIEDIAANGEDENFYRQIVEDCYQGEYADDY